MSNDDKWTILVTGGTGLVGSGVRDAVKSDPKYCEYNWIFSSSNECNLLDREATLAYFNQIKPTHVIHLAARVGGLYANLNDPFGFLFDNLRMNLNVIDAALACGCRNMLCCLSTCAFPHDVTFPVKEEDMHKGPPHDSIYAYGSAKRMLETMCRATNEKFGTNFVSFIPTNIFGPHDNFNLVTGHVVPALIHKAYAAKQDSVPLQLKGTGKALRQFIYSKDLGRLIVHMLFHYDKKESMCLSPPEEDEVSIAQVAETIAKAYHLPAVEYDASCSDGQIKKTVDNQRLRDWYPDFQFTDITKALQETCAWFAENYETARK